MLYLLCFILQSLTTFALVIILYSKPCRSLLKTSIPKNKQIFLMLQDELRARIWQSDFATFMLLTTQPATICNAVVKTGTKKRHRPDSPQVKRNWRLVQKMKGIMHPWLSLWLAVYLSLIFCVIEQKLFLADFSFRANNVSYEDEYNW